MFMTRILQVCSHDVGGIVHAGGERRRRVHARVFAFQSVDLQITYITPIHQTHTPHTPPGPRDNTHEHAPLPRSLPSTAMHNGRAYLERTRPTKKKYALFPPVRSRTQSVRVCVREWGICVCVFRVCLRLWSLPPRSLLPVSLSLSSRNLRERFLSPSLSPKKKHKKKQPKF